MRNNIPALPNPAIAQILKSSQMRTLMTDRTEKAQTAYRVIVAKRTGALAASARVEIFEGGRNKDRLCGRLIVGDRVAFYAASHEFGTDDGDLRIRPGARDLNIVLNQLGSL